MTRTKPRPRRRSPLATLNATSLYETCATALNREIETGALRPGQRLPSERSLGDALGFTRLTVRRALQVLAERGLLEPDERRGWQVRSGQVSDSLSTLMGFTQMARMRGLVASSRILSLEYRDATFDESEALRVAPGAPMLDLSRLRLLDDRPTAIERLRMPTSRLRWPDGFDFTGSIYAALESQGIVPTIADAYVDVVDATEADASFARRRDGPRPVAHELRDHRCRRRGHQPRIVHVPSGSLSIPRDPAQAHQAMSLTARARRCSALRGFTAALVIAGISVGCGSNDSDKHGGREAAAGGRHVLEVWTPESGSRLQLVQQRADQFSAAHPDVKVNFTIRDFGSYPAQLKLALASDSPPDVVIGNLGWSLDGPLIKAGLLRALDPWAARYGWDKRYPEVAQRQMRFTHRRQAVWPRRDFRHPIRRRRHRLVLQRRQAQGSQHRRPGHSGGARGGPRDRSQGWRSADHAGKQGAMARPASFLSGQRRSRVRS